MEQFKRNIITKEAQSFYYSSFKKLWDSGNFGIARRLQNRFRYEFFRYSEVFKRRDADENNKRPVFNEFSENIINISKWKLEEAK